MKRLAFLLAASAFASPALAQHEDHEDGPLPAEAPAGDPHAGHGMAEPDPHADHRSQTADPHADHRSHSSPAPEDPHAGHGMAEQDAHAGHSGPPDAQPDPHAGHDTTHTAADPPIAPPGPAAFSGPEHAADAYFGQGPMASARAEMHRMHGAVRVGGMLVDRLEAKVREGRETYALDAQGWYGGDLDKLWFKLEAHGDFGGEFEGAELQALWSHAVGPFFDLQAGVRFDAGPGPERAHLAFGFLGLAPYWIEVDAAAFLSDRGDVTARIEAEHDARITRRLILQPRLEAQFALQDIPSLQIGSGLSEFSAGARLRYQVTPLFAPYIGLEYERAFGDTRRLRRLAAEDLGGLGFVAGVRFRF